MTTPEILSVLDYYYYNIPFHPGMSGVVHLCSKLVLSILDEMTS